MGTIVLRGVSALLLLRLARVSVDTLVLQVIAWIMRQHTRRNEHCGTLQCRVSLEGAGQRACTVPTSTTNTVIRLELYHPILSPSAKNGNSVIGTGSLSSRPMNGDGTSHSIC